MIGTQRTFDVSAFFNDYKMPPFNYFLIVLSWLITVFDGLDIRHSVRVPYAGFTIRAR